MRPQLLCCRPEGGAWMEGPPRLPWPVEIGLCHEHRLRGLQCGRPSTRSPRGDLGLGDMRLPTSTAHADCNMGDHLAWGDGEASSTGGLGSGGVCIPNPRLACRPPGAVQ